VTRSFRRREENLSRRIRRGRIRIAQGFGSHPRPDCTERRSLGHIKWPQLHARSDEPADTRELPEDSLTSGPWGASRRPLQACIFHPRTRSDQGNGGWRPCVTLDVALGTFLQPIAWEEIEGTQMHAEALRDSEPAAKAICNARADFPATILGGWGRRFLVRAWRKIGR